MPEVVGIAAMVTPCWIRLLIGGSSDEVTFGRPRSASWVSWRGESRPVVQMMMSSTNGAAAVASTLAAALAAALAVALGASDWVGASFLWDSDMTPRQVIENAGR